MHNYPINSTQYYMKYIMVVSSEASMKLNLKQKVIQYIIRYKSYVNVDMLTIVYRFQYPISPYRPGISSSLDEVIKSSNSEMSLISNASWYDAEV